LLAGGVRVQAVREEEVLSPDGEEVGHERDARGGGDPGVDLEEPGGPCRVTGRRPGAGRGIAGPQTDPHQEHPRTFGLGVEDDPPQGGLGVVEGPGPEPIVRPEGHDEDVGLVLQHRGQPGQPRAAVSPLTRR
jgi:hypothetical protein